jgi:hypothetical protein
VKAGWNYACGEFGSEGLEDENLMRALYPAAWLEDAAERGKSWSPQQIHQAQTGTHHFLWIEPGDSMAEWVRRSQAHQEWATRLMTEAFRRNNRMIGFAIHLFIDAWPAGWMKSIIDSRRNPKPAYFAFREALAPLAVSLRLDRTAYHSGETIEAEVWLANDTSSASAGLQLAYQLEVGGEKALTGRAPARSRPGEAVFQGRVSFDIPPAVRRGEATLRVGLISGEGAVLHDSACQLDIFPLLPADSRLAGCSLGGEKADELAAELALRPGGDVVLLSDPAQLGAAHAAAEAGATVLLCEFPPGTFPIAGT